MAKEHITTCPVCGNTSFTEKFFCEDYLVSHEKFPINCCVACSFYFTQSTPEANEIHHYYQADEYVSHTDTKKGLINRIYHIVRERMLLRKAKIVEMYAQKGNLLDIGCGTGYFAETMQKRGWNVSVVEPAEEAAILAKQRLNIEVNKSLFSECFNEKHFNSITLWHVLEHLIDLNAAMEQLYKLLKDDGSLIIAVPNIQSYDSQKYKEFWAAFDVPRHIWHFSPETIALLSQQHGFKPINTYPMPFDAFYISMLSEKNKHSKFQLLRGCLFGILSYFRCLFNKQKSSSLIYILKKQVNSHK